MTEHEQIVLGEYCEDLLQQESFNTLAELFAKQKFDDFIATDLTEKDKREATFASCKALADFLGLMKACVEVKNHILEKDKPALPEDEGALAQDIEE